MANLALGIRLALRFIKDKGIKKGLKLAKAHPKVSTEELNTARRMAFGEPRKYLPKWHSMAKSKVQKKIDDRNRWLDKGRKEGF
jgi:hypothetical protein